VARKLATVLCIASHPDDAYAERIIPHGEADADLARMPVRAVKAFQFEQPSMRRNRSRYDRCDYARSNRRENVIAINFPPLISRRGGAQMTLPIIHLLSTLPVLIAHLRALPPLVVMDVLMGVVVVIVRECLRVGGHYRRCEQ
jgi:hypothetical protein